MEHRNSDRGRRLLGAAAVVAVTGLGLGAPVVAAPGVSAPSTKDVELTSGTSLQSTWEIVNNAGTTNGLPAGGECPDPQIPGLGVSDASSGNRKAQA